jgi:hypothetical protein
MTVTNRVSSRQSAQIARTRPEFNATREHGRAFGVLCFASYVPSMSVCSTSRDVINRQSILHAACSLTARGLLRRRSRILLLRALYSAFVRRVMVTTATTAAARAAKRPTPEEPPSPSELFPRLLPFEGNLCARALDLRLPLGGRTPLRAPGMFGGMRREATTEALDFFSSDSFSKTHTKFVTNTKSQDATTLNLFYDAVLLNSCSSRQQPWRVRLHKYRCRR